MSWGSQHRCANGCEYFKGHFIAKAWRQSGITRSAQLWALVLQLRKPPGSAQGDMKAMRVKNHPQEAERQTDVDR